MSSSSLIRFNPKEFHYYKSESIWINGLMFKTINYGYIGLLNYSFYLN